MRSIRYLCGMSAALCATLMFDCSFGALVAASEACSSKAAARAEEAVNKLDNWEAMHEFYRKFKNCDDGDIADELTDKVVFLLTERWAELASLLTVIRSDEHFGKFVLDHIDSTASSEALLKIEGLAHSQCPPQQGGFCKRIAHAARAASK